MSPDPGTVPSRWEWRVLDAEQAAELWEELADWVAWLRDRWELGTKVPPCWFAHPPVVEELTALMAGWKAAYEVERTEDGSVPGWAWYRQDMTSFLTHEFWPTITRIRTVSDFTNCTVQACSYEDMPAQTLHTLGEVVARDVDARR